MAENWIEKAAEEIEELVELKETIGAKAAAAIILSHAPVIDAEKTATDILCLIAAWEADKVNWRSHRWKDTKNAFAQLITSNLELSITWGKQGRADWGEFHLSVENCFDDIKSKRWSWYLNLRGVIANGIAKSQALAKAACVDALKKIITGGKG